MLLSAKYKLGFLLLVCLTGITLLVNSCKKDNSDTLAYFLTNGTWQLASVQVTHYIGDTQQGLTDTLNLTCNTIQTFAFKADNSCSYQNYHCITQSSTGAWSIDQDNLTLSCSMTAQDTLTVSKVTTMITVKAFSTAHIDNLGQYSLVLTTGDIQSFYKPTTPRTIFRYGFVHSR